MPYIVRCLSGPLLQDADTSNHFHLRQNCVDKLFVVYYYPHKNSQTVKKWCGLKKPG